MGSFFAKIWNWLQGAFTKHNAVAVLTTVERAGKTAADVESGNIAAAVSDAAATVDAAKSVHVNTTSSTAKTVDLGPSVATNSEVTK